MRTTPDEANAIQTYADKGYTAGYKAGAEAMRAAVLEVCRKLEKENVLRQLVVSHVRALPLPEPPK